MAHSGVMAAVESNPEPSPVARSPIDNDDEFTSSMNQLAERYGDERSMFSTIGGHIVSREEEDREEADLEA